MRKRSINSPRHQGRKLAKLKNTATAQPKKKINKRSHSSNLLLIETSSSSIRLPNLYEPSLAINQIYYASEPAGLGGPPSTDFLPKDYNGEFTFRLEINQLSERLKALHLEMKAMRTPPVEKKDDSDHHRQHQKRSTTNPESDPLPEHRRRTRVESTSTTTDHGPSGPPPSEPPPPLPRTISKTKTPVSVGVVPPPPPINPTQQQQQQNNNGGIKKNKKKGKKRRSAHANANNIHHRDNYVPSRLPTTSYGTNRSNGILNSNDLLDGLADFIGDSGSGTTTAHRGIGSEDWNRFRLDFNQGNYTTQQQQQRGRRGGGGFIDPTIYVESSDDEHLEKKMTESKKQKKKKVKNERHCQLGKSPIARFFVEPDEWICSFCEYELWFGEPISLIKVIKNRKEVLKRRKRALDRAARSANGFLAAPNSNSTTNTTNTNKKTKATNLTQQQQQPPQQRSTVQQQQQQQAKQQQQPPRPQQQVNRPAQQAFKPSKPTPTPASNHKRADVDEDDLHHPSGLYTAAEDHPSGHIKSPPDKLGASQEGEEEGEEDEEEEEEEEEEEDDDDEEEDGEEEEDDEEEDDGDEEDDEEELVSSASSVPSSTSNSIHSSHSLT
ncbi:hypothetical protein MJO29_010850 [Puccinia striiformis f. sp. tritici]|nr:hypothetical protein MJO29_010850 [Puccinia striiformis f. sp. tritici]